MDNLIYLVPVMGAIGLLYTFIKFSWVSKQDAGNDRMKEISTYIAEGAMAFLKAEWKILTYFVVIAAVLSCLYGHIGILILTGALLVAFIIGAFFSALAGYIGMRIATKGKRTYRTGSTYQFKKSTRCILYRRFGNGTWCCRSRSTWSWRTVHHPQNDISPQTQQLILLKW